jgi:pilus assembly protein TadC
MQRISVVYSLCHLLSCLEPSGAPTQDAINNVILDLNDKESAENLSIYLSIYLSMFFFFFISLYSLTHSLTHSLSLCCLQHPSVPSLHQP